MKRLSVFETNTHLDDLDYEAIPLTENCSVIPFLGHVPTAYLTEQSTAESWATGPFSIMSLDARTFVAMGLDGDA